MPRMPRIYMEGILYYVTSQCSHAHQEGLFAEAEDYREYTSLLTKYKKQHGFKLFSYVLMPSQVNLLIELKNNIHISNIMHDINSLYTKMFNGKYSKKGHLFRERFKAMLAEKEPNLLPLTRHIHLSPVREELALSPGEYPYSSYRGFLEPAQRLDPDMTDEIREVFDLLDGEEEAFRDYTENCPGTETDEYSRKVLKKRILGSKPFASDLMKAMEEAVKTPPAPKVPARMRLRVLVIAGIALIGMLFTVAYLHRQSTRFKTEFEESMELYENTLKALEKERDRALSAQEDIKNYQWKIRLTEQALEDLKIEKENIEKKAKVLDGFYWRVRVRQTGGPSATYPSNDTLSFYGGRVLFSGLSNAGFGESHYSRKELRNGKIIWETIQSGPGDQTASLRGEWDGRTMSGVFRRKLADGRIGDFTFVSTSDRLER